MPAYAPLVGEARRRQVKEAGRVLCPPSSHDFVRQFEAGEADLVLGELMARGRALLGPLANLYVETSTRHVVYDPRTGRRVHVQRFCVGQFATEADANLPAPQRRQRLLARGASWAEAFGMALAALRRGASVS